MIGGLLIATGLIETLAGSLRRETRPFVMAAGAVTAFAGLLFITNPETHFFPRVWPIIGWLLIRSLILAAATAETRGSVRRWTAFSAAMDFLLAVLLIAGLSISTIVVDVFGPTRELIASFAWILAASFVVERADSVAGRELRRGVRRLAATGSVVHSASRARSRLPTSRSLPSPRLCASRLRPCSC